MGRGVSRDQHLEVKADGSISLRRLPNLSGGASLQFSEREAEGLAGALQQELTEAGRQLSQDQIKCMQPFIARILDGIFGPQGTQTAATTPSRSSGQVRSTDAAERAIGISLEIDECETAASSLRCSLVLVGRDRPRQIEIFGNASHLEAQSVFIPSNRRRPYAAAVGLDKPDQYLFVRGTFQPDAPRLVYLTFKDAPASGGGKLVVWFKVDGTTNKKDFELPPAQ